MIWPRFTITARCKDARCFMRMVMVRGSSRNFSKIHDWALWSSVPSMGAGRGLSSVDDMFERRKKETWYISRYQYSIFSNVEC